MSTQLTRRCSRRRFLGSLTLAGTAGLLGLHTGRVTAEPPEITTIPTHPGVYWYRPVGLSSSLRLEVRLTEGELTVWWADRPITIAKLMGYWRGPIPSSTEPGNRQTSQPHT